MSIENFDTLIELQLSGSDYSFHELHSFFKNNGYINSKEEDFEFNVAFFGDVGRKWYYNSETDRYYYKQK